MQQVNQDQEKARKCFLCPDVVIAEEAFPLPDDLYPLDNIWCGPYFDGDADQTKDKQKSRNTSPGERWVHQDCKRWAHELMNFDEYENKGKKRFHGLKNVEGRQCYAGCMSKRRASVVCSNPTCQRSVHYRCLRTIKVSKRAIIKENCYFFCDRHEGQVTSNVSKVLRDTWEKPRGKQFPAMTCFPEAILQYCQDEALRRFSDKDDEFYGDFNYTQHVERVFTEWPKKQQQFFKELMSDPEHVKRARLKDAEAMGTHIADSLILNEGVSKGLFCNVGDSKQVGTMFGNYFGTIVYRDLQAYKDMGHLNADAKIYGEENISFMGTDLQRFTDYGIQVQLSDAASKKLRRKFVWIIPAKFCAAGYVNNYEYFEGDLEINLPPSERRRPHVEFSVSTTSQKVTDLAQLRKSDIITMTVRTPIEAPIDDDPINRKEIYADYKGTYHYDGEGDANLNNAGDPPNPLSNAYGHLNVERS